MIANFDIGEFLGRYVDIRMCPGDDAPVARGIVTERILSRDGDRFLFWQEGALGLTSLNVSEVFRIDLVGPATRLHTPREITPEG